MPQITDIRYVIRWFQQDGDGKPAPVSRFVILAGATNDIEARLRYDDWVRQNPDPFFGRPGILGPHLYKTERII